MTGEREASMRLFVAIELPEAWLEALARAQESLREALSRNGGPRLRYVRPEGIHLTLKFLGQVPESRLDSVRKALRDAIGDGVDISLTLGGMGAFGDRRGPRVVWVGLDGRGDGDRKALRALADSVESQLAAAGFPAEGRFQPHLTLARVPEEANREQRALVARASEAVRLPPAPPFVVRTVALMRSHLGPGGARYERLLAVP